jgi:hypothetical protein
MIRCLSPSIIECRLESKLLIIVLRIYGLSWSQNFIVNSSSLLAATFLLLDHTKSNLGSYLEDKAKKVISANEAERGFG